MPRSRLRRSSAEAVLRRSSACSGAPALKARRDGRARPEGSARPDGKLSGCAAGASGELPSDAPLDEPLGLEPPREPGPIEERRA